METLQEFEAKIDALIRLEFEPERWPDCEAEDGSVASWHHPYRGDKPWESAVRLREASAEIRRKLWSEPFLGRARDLAARADREASRIEVEVEGFARSPHDRFPAATSNGIVSPAIP